MTEIIPAIDLIDGRCVRLTQGDYGRVSAYAMTPADMARAYADCGIRRIHVVDLDGAKASEPANLRTLEAMASIASAPAIEWGGGLKSEHALRQVFDAGATYTIVGSLAAKEPQRFVEWLHRFSPERMVLGADVREGKVSVSGWQEDLPLGIDDLIDGFLEHGLSQCICTEISRDGMLQGPATEMYLRLQEKYAAVDFTVSGGIASADDIRALHALGLRKVIVGKAIYEGRISMAELQRLAEECAAE